MDLDFEGYDFSWLKAFRSDRYKQCRRRWHEMCCSGRTHSATSAQAFLGSIRLFSEVLLPGREGEWSKQFLSLTHLHCNHLLARAEFESVQYLANLAANLADTLLDDISEPSDCFEDWAFLKYTRYRSKRFVFLAERNQAGCHSRAAYHGLLEQFHEAWDYGAEIHPGDNGNPSVYMRSKRKYKELYLTAASDICRLIYRQWLGAGCRVPQRSESAPYIAGDLDDQFRKYANIFTEEFDRWCSSGFEPRPLHVDTRFRLMLMRYRDAAQVVKLVTEYMDRSRRGGMVMPSSDGRLLELEAVPILDTEWLALAETKCVAMLLADFPRAPGALEDIVAYARAHLSISTRAGYLTAANHFLEVLSGPLLARE